MQLISLLFGLAFAGLSFAQKEDENRVFKHPLTDMAPPSEDIITTALFPDHHDKKLPIGDVVSALCHFSNEGSSYYNISAIMGSLNSPYDFHHHFQNYSYKPFGIVIKDGEEITLSYNFQLHPELDPVEYQLAITVFYESETEQFSTTFFNETVELYYPTSEYDFDSISSVGFALASTFVVVLVSIIALCPESKFVSSMLPKPKNNVKNRSGVVSDGDESDSWTKVESKKTKRKKSKQDVLEDDDE